MLLVSYLCDWMPVFCAHYRILAVLHSVNWCVFIEHT